MNKKPKLKARQAAPKVNSTVVIVLISITVFFLVAGYIRHNSKKNTQESNVAHQVAEPRKFAEIEKLESGEWKKHSGQDPKEIIGEWKPLSSVQNGETVIAKETHIVTATEWRIETNEETKIFKYRVYNVAHSHITLVADPPVQFGGYKTTYINVWVSEKNRTLHRCMATGFPAAKDFNKVQYALGKQKDIPAEVAKVDALYKDFKAQQERSALAAKKDKSLAKKFILDKLREIKFARSCIPSEEWQTVKIFKDAPLFGGEGLSGEEKVAWMKRNYYDELERLTIIAKDADQAHLKTIAEREGDIARRRAEADFNEEEYKMIVKEFEALR